MSDRQKLNEVPPPPGPCSEREAALFRDKAQALIEQDNLYQNMLEGLATLCTHEIWLENIHRRNKRILDVLDLETIPAKDEAPLFTVQSFDRRFMDLLGEGKEQTEAYVITESEHRARYGVNKFKNFQSYYRAWRRRQKQKLNGIPENRSGADDQ